MATPQVTGVRETLAALKSIDKKLERESRKRMRQTVAPLQNEARSLIPSGPPMSGWTRGRYAFDGGKAKAGVRVKIGGSASRKKESWPLVTMTQNDAAGIIFDMAGRRSSGRSASGRQFIANLNRFGRASRSMWKAAEGPGLKIVQRDLVQAVNDAAKAVNAEIGRG
jgi:hypothetical protein